MKTFSIKFNDIKRNWYYVDANKKVLGRLASVLATYLRGKHKIKYTPHLDTGDYIIVLNASKILITGKKNISKLYYHHTGYIGGIKKTRFEEMISLYPERVIKNAVKGMLPKGSLGRSMLKKLKIFANEDHSHIAQCPKLLNIL